MLSIKQLPFPRHEGIKHLHEVELIDDLQLEQWTIPKKTKVKLITTRNFGFVITPDLGNPRRIFKY